jgi:oxygen-dependent protoporphyrinogen oxidase
LGREAFDRLVQPLVSGIYTADADKLSLAATLPRFIEMERRHGSLIKAALRERSDSPTDSGARYSLFAAPRDGMSSFVAALAARLPPGCVRLNAPVARIEPTSAGAWNVCLASDGAAHSEIFNAVIVATPAPLAARLVEGVDAGLAALLRSIPYAGAAIALAGYLRQQIGRPLDGFGFVVPTIDGRRILSASFSSMKFAGRAPPDRVLLRVFLGGAARPDLVEASDGAIRTIVQEELGELLEVRGEPELFEVVRWPQAMPQYHLGHVERVAQIENRLETACPGLALAGNAYHGVGIPHCIHDGEAAAERVWRGVPTR